METEAARLRQVSRLFHDAGGEVAIDRIANRVAFSTQCASEAKAKVLTELLRAKKLLPVVGFTDRRMVSLELPCTDAVLEAARIAVE